MHHVRLGVVQGHDRDEEAADEVVSLTRVEGVRQGGLERGQCRLHRLHVTGGKGSH